jgi:hypothetical protein
MIGILRGAHVAGVQAATTEAACRTKSSKIASSGATEPGRHEPSLLQWPVHAPTAHEPVASRELTRELLLIDVAAHQQLSVWLDGQCHNHLATRGVQADRHLDALARLSRCSRHTV